METWKLKFPRSLLPGVSLSCAKKGILNENVLKIQLLMTKKGMKSKKSIDYSMQNLRIKISMRKILIALSGLKPINKKIHNLVKSTFQNKT